MRKDPRGRNYYWIAGDRVKGVRIKGTDCDAVLKGYVSVTPIFLDQTAFKYISKLNEQF